MEQRESVQSDGQWLTTKDGFEEEDHECQTTDDKVMSLVAQESRKSDIRVQYMDDFNTFNNRDADAPKFVTFKDVREDTMEFVEGNETGRFGNTNAASNPRIIITTINSIKENAFFKFAPLFFCYYI